MSVSEKTDGRRQENRSLPWWKNAVIYQIYPRSFYDTNGDGIGDIEGIIRKAGYLEELGVDAVWLTPIYPSPDEDFGYDIEDYYSVHPLYGDLSKFDELVVELHRRNIKIVMDLVLNHTSTTHKWFTNSEKEPDGPYGDFYIWKQGNNGGPPNNWDSFFGGPAWKYSPIRGEYYLHLFSENQADLNWENPEVRRELYRVIRWWKERGVDGFRLDVINMISKDREFPDDLRDLVPPAVHGTPYVMNGPKLHDYLAEMRGSAIKESYTVGECPGAGYDEVLRLSGYGRGELDEVFQMELMELDHGPGGKWDIRPWSTDRFLEIIDKWQRGLESQAWPANFLTNHDQPRALSRFGEEGTHRYESSTLLATVLFTLTGTTFLYYGEEIGMINSAYRDIDSYRDVDTLNFYSFEVEQGKTPEEIMKTIRYMSRDNARSPMQWNGEPHAGFMETIETEIKAVKKSVPWIPVAEGYEQINVEAEKEAERRGGSSILGYYKELLRLRKSRAALYGGLFRPLTPDAEGVIAYTKTTDKNTTEKETVEKEKPEEGATLEVKETEAEGPAETYLVLARFASTPVETTLTENSETNQFFSAAEGMQPIIHNYPSPPKWERGPQSFSIELRPYEAAVFRLEG